MWVQQDKNNFQQEGPYSLNINPAGVLAGGWLSEVSLEELFLITEYSPRAWNPNISLIMSEGGIFPSEMNKDRN